MEETASLVVDAFDRIGITARPPSDVRNRADLVLEPHGVDVGLEIKRWALVDDHIVDRLKASRRQTTHAQGRQHDGGVVLMVVGDRVTESARREILANHWGYYDLRGHLALRSNRMVVSADIESVGRRRERVHAISGKVGLEVATALLMEPERGPAVRELSRELHRSASMVSEVMSRLRKDRLITSDNRVSGTQLFWEVADRWPTKRTYLGRVPQPGEDTAVTRSLRLGLEDVEATAGWALTDTAAAAAHGAPVAVRTGQVLDFFVPDQTVVRRAGTLLGVTASPSQARCTVRVAPVPAVCRHRTEPEANYFEWPTAHPVFVALDLAQDTGRGHEILREWTPTGRWARVW